MQNCYEKIFNANTNWYGLPGSSNSPDYIPVNVNTN